MDTDFERDAGRKKDAKARVNGGYWREQSGRAGTGGAGGGVVCALMLVATLY